MYHIIFAGGMAGWEVQLSKTFSPSWTVPGTPDITGSSSKATAQTKKSLQIPYLKISQKCFLLAAIEYFIQILLDLNKIRILNKSAISKKFIKFQLLRIFLSCEVLECFTRSIILIQRRYKNIYIIITCPISIHPWVVFNHLNPNLLQYWM